MTDLTHLQLFQRKERIQALQKLDRQHRKALERAAELLKERDHNIRAAVRAGISQADLARALNLTTARLSQILKG